ncbi:MAG: HAMP domain-containing protein [Ignavibacteriales bacterium]|nr:MAG: HAMP domain-containing protein [Ignavibacteriales bacterium]
MNLSWQKKLFIFAILTSIIPLFISGYVMISMTDEELKSSTNNELISTTGAVAGELNNLLLNTWLAPLEIVKSGLENPSLGPAEKEALLNSIVKNVEGFVYTGVYFEMSPGDFQNALSAFKPSSNTAISVNTPEYRGAIGGVPEDIVKMLEKKSESGMAYILSDPRYNQNIQTWLMECIVDIKISGAPRGILIARINLNDFFARLRNNPFNKTGKLYIINGEGENIASEGKENLSQLKIVQDIKTLIAQKLRSNGVTSYETPDGQVKVASFSFPENLDWVVFAEKDEDVAYATVDKMTFTLWVLVALGLFVGIGGALVSGGVISQPIRKLRNIAETISSGNFDVEVEYKANDAIGTLGNTLVSMAHSLKESFKKIALQNKELEEYSKTLEIKVEERTIELKDKNTELEKTLIQLKETQAQLVMQQKLASLGALTAGIAHEIKNPLNFVNNFAKLTTGLVDELHEEIDRVKTDPAKIDAGYLEEIFGDIKTNVTKIGEHGARADNIVKGMLEHSRGDTGEFQMTDLNGLLAESLDNGYNAVKNNRSGFLCELKKTFDSSIEKININPQTFSRVMVNIFENAFYAMFKKGEAKGSGYKPELELITKKSGEEVEIRIKDNGTGIPQSVIDKVFEPFFTTKPTGEGTGLGLSLSYDIITQIHKGKLSVASVEGESTEFIITIPVS